MNQVIDRRTDAILRLPQVRQITGLGRSSIYALQETQGFPHSIKLSHRAVGWLESEVLAWMNSRIQERGGTFDRNLAQRQQRPGTHKHRVVE